MNWTIIILLGIGAVALVVFLIVRNMKDEKNFEDQLNNNYPKPKNNEGDIEIDDKMK
jgi:hypothetical protein